MENSFTEKDAIQEAHAIHVKLIGSELNSDEAPIQICPILTAGRMANPHWQRGAVSCLKDECALYDIDSIDDIDSGRQCQIYRAGMVFDGLDDALGRIYELLRKHL